MVYDTMSMFHATSCLVSFGMLTSVFMILCCLTGEDDGHLVTFTQDQTSGASEMRVYNAKTMTEAPTASVQLPIRCPSGFHCYHMSEEQFQAQSPLRV